MRLGLSCSLQYSFSFNINNPYGVVFTLAIAPCSVSCYIYLMSVTQTVDIPANHRLTIDVPREIPMGRAILTFTPTSVQRSQDQRYDATLLPGGSYNTVKEALQAAAEKAADPHRKPISRLFGKHKGIFGGDGVAYQRAIRD
jgi:hypothetical protein